MDGTETYEKVLGTRRRYAKARCLRRRLGLEWSGEGPIEESSKPADSSPLVAVYRISSGPDERCYLGGYCEEYEGAFQVLLRVWRKGSRREARKVPAAVWASLVPPMDFAESTSEQGSLEYYVYGADLDELRRARVRVSLSAARILYGAARVALDAVHRAGVAHGALTARKIRLALRGQAYRFAKGPCPVLFVGARPRPGTRAVFAKERGILRRAVSALTAEPSRTGSRLRADDALTPRRAAAQRRALHAELLASAEEEPLREFAESVASAPPGVVQSEWRLRCLAALCASLPATGLAGELTRLWEAAARRSFPSLVEEALRCGCEPNWEGRAQWGGLYS